jgi:hypothetical protein
VLVTAPQARRLLVDPSVLRVSIRREDEGWLVTIQRQPPAEWRSPRVSSWSTRVEDAIKGALNEAARQGLPGLDPECEWAYLTWPRAGGAG